MIDKIKFPRRNYKKNKEKHQKNLCVLCETSVFSVGNKKIGISLSLAFLLVLFLVLTSCQHTPRSVCEKQGIRYCRTQGIFGGKWFDYYERGLSCMEGQCYDAAMSDFTQAIRRKDADMRMARTYGFHFADYFPHREKGIVHYLLGDYEHAQKELEISLQSVRTEKALIWLDEVRRKLLDQAGQAPEQSVLALDFSDMTRDSDGIFHTNKDPLILSGSAADQHYVSAIFMEDQFEGRTQTRKIFLESSEQKTAFREEFSPEDGLHHIRIIAENLLYGQTVQKFQIYADRTGPLIVLEIFNPGILIKGFVRDESGQISLAMNGKPVTLVQKENLWQFEIPLHADTAFPTLTAIDMVGNQTVAVLGENMSAGNSNLFAQSANAITDTEPGFHSPRPVIALKDWADQETVYADRVLLQGQVKSDASITELHINGKSAPNSTGTLIFFTHSLKLEEGENKLTIAARDAIGRENIKTVFIERKIPQAFQWKNRFRLAVHPFDGAEISAETKQFQYLWLQQLADRRRFCLLMRKEIQKILSDFPSLPDRSSHQPPHAMIFGMIHQTDRGTEIVAELTDKTSESIAFADVYALRGKQDSPQLLADRLAEKFHRKFPLHNGTVTEITNEIMQIKNSNTMAVQEKNRMQWPMLIFRPEKANPDFRGCDTLIVGFSRISQILPDGYESHFIPGTCIGDRSITQ
ncbi:MAG: hypothetical protein AB7S75_06090 [Desulfococcaceae bacterium]